MPKRETLETAIWKMEVTLYRTGTIHLLLTNKLKNETQTFLIRKGGLRKVIKEKSYIA